MSTASGSSASISSSGERVVAVHERLRAELPEVLDEVVDEGVVVVDDQDADRRCGAEATARGWATVQPVPGTGASKRRLP